MGSGEDGCQFNHNSKSPLPLPFPLSPPPPFNPIRTTPGPPLSLIHLSRSDPIFLQSTPISIPHSSPPSPLILPTSQPPTTPQQHFPWFATFNTLDHKIPKKPDDQWYTLCRSAGMGFTSSVVSDSASNSIRVVKTYRQTHAQKISYPAAVKEIVAQDGVIGLFGRGLKTRIMVNGMQGLMFSVLWTHFSEKMNSRLEKKTQ